MIHHVQDRETKAQRNEITGSRAPTGKGQNQGFADGCAWHWHKLEALRCGSKSTPFPELNPSLIEIARASVLSQGQFCHQGTFGQVWRHFGLILGYHRKWGYYGHPVGRVWECRSAPYTAQHSPLPQQRMTQPKMSLVPRLRNPELHVLLLSSKPIEAAFLPHMPWIRVPSTVWRCSPLLLRQFTAWGNIPSFKRHRKMTWRKVGWPVSSSSSQKKNEGSLTEASRTWCGHKEPVWKDTVASLNLIECGGPRNPNTF